MLRTLCLLALSLTACLAPPAVMPGAHVDSELAIGLYPAGTERVEVHVEGDDCLRGFFVPAGDDAPVVLHLLESSGSAASLKLHYEPLTVQLQGLGFASLILDYRGVGASDGSRSARHLQADARAMWHEAARRANGDASRVLLRGISLGTVAIAELLEAGIEPGAVLLHAPVDGRNAVDRFSTQRFGTLITWLAAGFFSSVSETDLFRVLGACDSPMLVIAGSKDFFLNDEERARLQRTVLAVGDRWASPNSGHLRQGLEAHALVVEELELLVRTFPPRPLSEPEIETLLAQVETFAGGESAPRVRALFADEAIRVRLARLGGLARNMQPVLTAAVVVHNQADLDSLRFLWMLNERDRMTQLPFDEIVEAVSLEDPAGALSVEAIVLAALSYDFASRFGGLGLVEGPGAILRRVAAELAGEDSRVEISIKIAWDDASIVSDPGEIMGFFHERSLTEEELARLAVRTLLKGARIPDRIRSGEDGEVVLEIYEDDAWEMLSPDPENLPYSIRILIPHKLGDHARALAREAKD